MKSNQLRVAKPVVRQRPSMIKGGRPSSTLEAYEDKNYHANTCKSGLAHYGDLLFNIGFSLNQEQTEKKEKNSLRAKVTPQTNSLLGK